MEFRTAIAQIDSRVGDLKNNVAHHEEFIDKALRQKASLIVFPELSLTGYTLRDLAWEIALDLEHDPVLDTLKKRSKRISIVLGCVESGRNHGIYNSAVFLEDGAIKHVHRKIYPPTYGMFEEGRYFSRGTAVRAFDSKLGRFGVLVCEDFWHLSLPYLLTMDGAEVLMCLTASPTRVGGDREDLTNARINHEHHRTYARLLSSYVLFSNRVGFEDGVNFWGGSVVTGPSGEHVAKAKYFEEDLIVSILTSQEVQRARRFSRHLLDEDPVIVRETLTRMKSPRRRKS
ncbi:MAG: carbon-nitrogen hydrolase [Ignavibacteriales bacterium]|nr:carbon-nitrogen hydrolase [Ignavibacteriales bacterium]